MLLTAILSLVAVVAGAAVSSPEAVAPVSLAARGGQCPAGYDYRGWFDKVNGIPPQCKVHVSRPRPMKKPSCPRGQAAYCSIDPGHFCPYDPAHAYCLDTGLGRCDCFDAHASVSTIQHLLGDLFCVVDKALALLGLECLLDPRKCRAKWQLLGLGCTVEELLWFIQHAVCTVIDLVGDILGSLLPGLFGRSA